MEETSRHILLRSSYSPSHEKDNEKVPYSKTRDGSRSPCLKEKKTSVLNRLLEESFPKTLQNTRYRSSPATRLSRSPSFPIQGKENSPCSSTKVIHESVCLLDENESEKQLTNLQYSVVEKELDKLLNESEVNCEYLSKIS